MGYSLHSSSRRHLVVEADHVRLDEALVRLEQGNGVRRDQLEPGRSSSWEMSRSGSYIGCGNSGAAMIGSSGSSGVPELAVHAYDRADSRRHREVGVESAENGAGQPARGPAAQDRRGPRAPAWSTSAILPAAVRKPAASDESVPAGLRLVGARALPRDHLEAGAGRRVGDGAGGHLVDRQTGPRTRRRGSAEAPQQCKQQEDDQDHHQQRDDPRDEQRQRHEQDQQSDYDRERRASAAGGQGAGGNLRASSCRPPRRRRRASEVHRGAGSAAAAARRERGAPRGPERRGWLPPAGAAGRRLRARADGKPGTATMAADALRATSAATVAGWPAAESAAAGDRHHLDRPGVGQMLRHHLLRRPRRELRLAQPLVGASMPATWSHADAISFER